ncbi:MAG: TRAP transporter substrate-binding protein DctP [Treponemataceae bacterium]
MKHMTRIALCAAFFVVFAASAAFGQKLTLKIASIAPENTPWGAALNKLASEWKTLTNGEIELKVYHNGIAGSEADMLRKLKLGQIQGAVFTSFGLNEISPEVLTLSCPFLIRDNAELDLALAGVRGDLEGKIEAKGFKIVAWSKAGWVRFFSKEPVFLPAQLKVQKLATDPNDMALMQAFKSLGYQLVPIPMGDTLMALNSGMVEAIYASPLAVGGFQLFGIAKNMASLKLAPFLGGIVLSNKTWSRIPEKYRTQIVESNRRLEKELDASILKLEDDAISTMSTYGLVTNQITPAQLKIWHEDVERGLPLVFGTSFDKVTYEKVNNILKKSRAAK